METIERIAIIPCAGVGSRMGYPSIGKEMLIDPVTMKPVIDWPLSLCQKYSLKPIVITTDGKVELQQYVQAFYPEAQLVITGYNKEWPETVLKTQPYWGKKNVLVLPDTRFTPEDSINEMLERLDMGLKIGVGLHKVPDEEHGTFGIVRYKGAGEAILVEKPNNQMEDTNTAWGLLSWVGNEGAPLFKNFCNRGKEIEVDDVFCLYLDSFIDITRTGTIQYY